MKSSRGAPGGTRLLPPPPHHSLSHNHDRSVKETNHNHRTNSLCNQLKTIEDLESTFQAGMQKPLLQQSTDAARKYYAAFPALKKGHQSPLLYFLPPPAWCRKPIEESNKRIIMQKVDPGDWTLRNKKLATCKERRNSYHGQKKSNSSKKRCHSYSKSFESKENLPEWVTHEGVWDLETQDPVREFIRAIALDEGYGTCENTRTDEIRMIARVDMRIKESAVPEWGDDMDLESEWVLEEEALPRPRSPTEEESYAKFEAKFDSSIEALWSKEQANTPDDECQELPIDFMELLSSPTDRPLYEPMRDKCSLISMSESIWSNDAFGGFLGGGPATPGASMDVLHDRFKPLKLADERRSPEEEPFSLYSYEDVYDSVPSVASVMRSLTALNHSKSRSSFTEVLPRRPSVRPPAALPGCASEQPARPPEVDEDLFTSERTHFRPIGKESLDAAAAPPPAPLYADGATFEICADLDTVTYCRSHSGSIFVESGAESSERYLEYRDPGAEMDAKLEFSLKFRVRQTEKGVQTEDKAENVVREEALPGAGGTGGERWGACDQCTRLIGAKKMRSSGAGLESIWSTGGGEQGAGGWCGACAAREPPPPPPPRPPLADEWSRDWEELLTDISCAHARYAAEAEETAGGGAAAAAELWRGDRKRRHSAMVWCAAGAAGARCPHPHDAPFLHFCASERPLTR